MSTVDALKREKEELQTKISQTEQVIGKGLSWKDAQFYLEKYKEEIRVIDVKIARSQLGEDAVSELRKKKEQLQLKMQSVEKMKKDGEISDKVYKDKKKDIQKEIQQVERDMVDTL